MVSFLADESVDYRIVQYLRNAGYSVKSIQEIAPSATDEQVLTIAENEKLVLVTEDKDFGELTFRLKKNSTGIVLLRFETIDLESICTSLSKAFRDAEKLFNNFTVISLNKIRMKLIRVQP
ncbi:MAG: DUF5615 family PIN-like protein [Chloroherpetonaceae bacterium]|nr:DUF5615 family PIN-like protein [Chloroherpetonaceae bacterium]